MYMRKMRVYEYAKEKNLTSREVLSKLQEAGIDITNHMSVIDEKMIQQIEGNNKEQSKEEPKKEKKQEKKKASKKQKANKPKQKNKKKEPSHRKKVTYTGSLTIAKLAKKLNDEPANLIKKLMELGVMATINQELDKDTIEILAMDYGVEVEEEVVVDAL